jgi:hypothetical protein
MAQLKVHKVVAALPDPLEADSVYFVRSGAGFDLYVTNSLGLVVAYALNAAPGWSTVEVELGAPQTRSKVFVPVAGLTQASRVEVLRSATPATGKGSDEHEAEPAALAAYATQDGFMLHVIGLGTSIGGPINIQYRVS